MSLKKTMEYIEQHKEEYLARKKNERKFICDHCLKTRDVNQKLRTHQKMRIRCFVSHALTIITKPENGRCPMKGVFH